MPDSPRETPTQWDSTDYDGSHSFVYEYGEDVVGLLDPQSGERVLDLGCGTGHLTDAIAASGADVVGVDSAPSMLADARASYPDCSFVLADARALPFAECFDAVFSNAALHWIRDQDAAVAAVANVLSPGGRFVAEMGGSGNVAGIVDAVFAELDERGYEQRTPWHFPSVGEYATRLESHGFEVRYATLFDRPTELDDGEDGLAAWLGMFGDTLLEPVPDDELDDVLRGVEERLRSEFYEDGVWTTDYRRLRFEAVKTHG